MPPAASWSRWRKTARGRSSPSSRAKDGTIALRTVGVTTSETLLPDANFIVNTAADTPDAHPGDGVCLDFNGFCSLRAAIQEVERHRRGGRYDRVRARQRNADDRIDGSLSRRSPTR
jgi:CSLREA domain-containing protein